ncbi:MAG: DUF1059 domain-containing protein [Candidatus Micrarchaeaceae archaeon]
MKKFECKTLGSDCQFSASAENAEEVVAKAEEHMATAHNMQRGEETKAKIRTALTEA